MENARGFKYVILPDLKLIVECWFGKFTLDEILELKMVEAQDQEWKDYYHVLADDRQTNFRIEALLEDSSKYLSLSQKFIKKRKTAMLTSLPNQVASSILFNLHKPAEALVEVEVFSTIEAALRWLNVSLTECDRIEFILEFLGKEIKSTNLQKE